MGFSVILTMEVLNRMQNNKFHQNLMWELEYLNESEGNLQRKEKKAFTIQGKLLSTEHQLQREVNKIRSVFTYSVGEEFDFIDYIDFWIFIISLEKAVNDITKFDKNIIKRIIVYLDLLLSIEVSFISALVEIKEMDQQVYEEIEKEFSFEKMYLTFKKMKFK